MKYVDLQLAMPIVHFTRRETTRHCERYRSMNPAAWHTVYTMPRIAGPIESNVSVRHTRRKCRNIELKIHRESVVTRLVQQVRYRDTVRQTEYIIITS